MALGFNSWVRLDWRQPTGTFGEHDFRSRSPYGEKELMMMMMVKPSLEPTSVTDTAYKHRLSLRQELFSAF